MTNGTVQGRPPFGIVLVDLPSDHEIDGGLVTEVQMINAILHNRRLGSRTKVFRATSSDTFNGISHSYKNLGFIHLGTHGSKKGISLIGSEIPWSDVARRLKVIAPNISDDKQRVLCLSCCHSRDGYQAMKGHLKGHFTGIYLFKKKKIEFATAMTVWSMFYRKKTIERPAMKIVASINEFFGEEVIRYHRI